jgi:hypothetical protein
MSGWTKEAAPPARQPTRTPDPQRYKPMRPSDNPFQLYDDPEEGVTPEMIHEATQELKSSLAHEFGKIEQIVEHWGSQYTKLGASDTATREAALVYAVRALKNFLGLK